MKLKIIKKEFINEIDKVLKAISSSISLPSLQGLYIRATESNVTILGSDGNFAIKNILQNNQTCSVQEPGIALIPAKLFREVISKQSSEIIIETTDSQVIIYSEGAKANISLLDYDEYPKISFDVIDKEFKVDAGVLREAIKNVSFASSDNDKRVILNGVNLKAQDGMMSITATNSYRLAREIIEINSNIDFNITVLSKNLKVFLPDNWNGEVKISVDDSKIVTNFDNLTILSRLIDGVYPEVERLIPNSFEHIIQINKIDLENLMEKVTVISSETNKVIKLSVNKDLLSLESRRQEIGEAKSETSNFNYNNSSFEIAFNWQFLKDAISKFKGELEICFVGDQKPFIVKSNSNTKLTQLILPHRSY